MFLEKQKIIFIHIPKTGGQSIEYYLADRFQLGINFQTLPENRNYLWKGNYKGHTLQHCFLQEIVELKNIQHLDEYLVFASIRHPYQRTLSALIFWGLLTEKNKHNLKQILIKFLSDKKKHDLHAVPQYKYLKYNGEIYKNIKLVRQEHLAQDMQDIGFPDFNERQNLKLQNLDYKSLLTYSVKNIIYQYYRKDFEIFGFKR